LAAAFGSGEPASAGTWAGVFATGLRLDLASAVWILLPLAFWVSAAPERVFQSAFHRRAFVPFLAFLSAVQLFFFVVEYAFFDEFNARFNTVAVDYVLYPHEVFVNIWESYPVVKIVLGCALGGALVYAVFRRALHPAWPAPGGRARLIFAATYVAAGVLITQSVQLSSAHRGDNRVLNEIASNGMYSLVNAAATRQLDYPAFYRTLPRGEAYARARALLTEPGVSFGQDPYTLERQVAAPAGARSKNVVVILVESFGSEFWGSLGRPDTLTPRMDALSKECLLFTNLYASGNRTVRGMEGVLASLPPLPGDSIVKRSLSDNVATVARTLGSRGYHTLFLYGGRGAFDGMRSFALRNGYERFIEQKDFSHPSFSTIWGVADEDLLGRALFELRDLHAAGRPFFVTVLTVSNHKPYTYPKGRIAENPDDHSRANAVKYTDWVLGEFFDRVRKERFFNDTVFAVVADHGARVYGHQTIPIASYRIPLLIVGSGVAPRRVDVLGGSLDVTPTVLSLAGVSYPSVFFGRDLLRIDPATGWAVMNHNRDIGLFQSGRMAVLGINKAQEFYRLNAAGELERVSSPEPEDELLARNAAGLYQVADELYTSQRYRVAAPMPARINRHAHELPAAMHKNAPPVRVLH
jgi:phosphoglycerol transferase MdoB-like AlkP superfamily enzyme